MTKISTSLKDEVIKALLAVQAIKYGRFILKDGSVSSIYIDLRILPNFPMTFRKIIALAADYLRKASINDNFDGIIAPPLAGIPLGVALALELDKEFYIGRIHAKEHGTQKLIEGDISNKRILIVDDVITSGGSKIPILEAVRTHGGDVTNLFVFVNRMDSSESVNLFEKENNIKIHSLVSLDDLSQK